MPRHADKRRVQLTQRHRQKPRRLRCIDDQRHLPLTAQGRDLVKRQDIAEHIRHVRADDSLCVRRHGFAEAFERILRVEQPRPGDGDLRADVMQRPRDCVVFKARDHHAFARADERLDGKIERVRRVHCKDHLLRRRVKQLPRQHAAVIDCLRRPHGGRMAAAARRGAAAHGALHAIGDHRRLLERGRTGIEIDHSAASSRYPFGCSR